jgi:hypothetical protein
MNIWLRIIATFIKSFFQSRIEPTDVLKTNMIVGPTEADLMYVSNARYLLFMEVARLEMMLRTGIFRIARKKHWLPLVASQMVHYERPLKRFQKFTLKSHLAAWDDKWFFIDHKIERNGKLMAFALAKCCFRGPEGVVSPADAFAELNAATKSIALPGYATQWTVSEELLRDEIIKI